MMLWLLVLMNWWHPNIIITIINSIHTLIIISIFINPILFQLQSRRWIYFPSLNQRMHLPTSLHIIIRWLFLHLWHHSYMFLLLSFLNNILCCWNMITLDWFWVHIYIVIIFYAIVTIIVLYCFLIIINIVLIFMNRTIIIVIVIPLYSIIQLWFIFFHNWICYSLEILIVTFYATYYIVVALRNKWRQLLIISINTFNGLP